MEVVYLGIILVIEIGLAIYCIRSSSYEHKKRAIVSISALFTFVLLILVSAIDWHPRWYAFAAWLFILAVVGAIALVHPKKWNNKAFQKSTVI